MGTGDNVLHILISNPFFPAEAAVALIRGLLSAYRYAGGGPLLDEVNNHGLTPFMFAAGKGKLLAALTLAEFGARMAGNGAYPAFTPAPVKRTLTWVEDRWAASIMQNSARALVDADQRAGGRRTCLRQSEVIPNGRLHHVSQFRYLPRRHS